MGRALRGIIGEHGLNVTKAAEFLAIPQPRMSSLLAGNTKLEPLDVFALERKFGLSGGTLSRHLHYLPVEEERLPLPFEEGLRHDPYLTGEEKRGFRILYRRTGR